MFMKLPTNIRQTISKQSLMGLPDDYAMSGTWNQKAKTIGNMVPPLLMSAIAKSLYEKIILPFTRNPQITYITAKNLVHLQSHLSCKV